MMSKFKLEIETDNAAFADDYNAEIARILRAVADKIERGIIDARILDINGNTVGNHGAPNE
jgi:hypothetical protein